MDLYEPLLTAMAQVLSSLTQGQDRRTIDLAQKWVKCGFFIIGWKWPRSGSKAGFRAFGRILPGIPLEDLSEHFFQEWQK